MRGLARIAAWLSPVSVFVACGGSPPPGDLGVWTPGGVPSAGSSAGASMPAVSGSGGAMTSGASSSSGGAPVGAGASSGASSGSSSGGGAPPTPSSGDGGTGGVPCDVATVLASKCTACHSDPPINGSLSGLVTYADLLATSKENPAQNEAQLSVSRMQNTASPMPPASVANPATASDIATLQNWISAGYPSGSCATDGGAGDSGPGVTVTDVFSGQPAYKATTGPSTHNQGKDCMACHTSGGNEAPQFLFGGTIYDGSGNPLAGAEVRVVDKNGKGYSVYSGPEGNFYQNGTGLAVPANAGARNASSKALMISAVSKPGCNSCHCTGSGCATTPIHLP
ncbi:MAG TPA: carboxypeptidase-like regulatory domain-containing protein [Polyangiaceae bacterium]|nr:carboxypeptidase-like regulatory domain-containing protein [Polyangiaceae bacterium]